MKDERMIDNGPKYDEETLAEIATEQLWHEVMQVQQHRVVAEGEVRVDGRTVSVEEMRRAVKSRAQMLARLAVSAVAHSPEVR